MSVNNYRVILGYLVKKADEEHLLPRDQQIKAVNDLREEQRGMLNSLNRRIVTREDSVSTHLDPDFEKACEVLRSFPEIITANDAANILSEHGIAPRLQNELSGMLEAEWEDFQVNYLGDED